MSKLTQFRSWNFNAEDLEKTVTFYQDVLGATVRKKHVVAGVDVVRLNLGGAVLGVFDASKDRHPRVPHHTFEIDARGEPEDFVKEIEAQGRQGQRDPPPRRRRLLRLRHRPQRKPAGAFHVVGVGAYGGPAPGHGLCLGLVAADMDQLGNLSVPNSRKATLGALCAALSLFMFAGPQPAVSDPVLIAKRESVYNNIYVFKEGPIITLTFGHNRALYTETVYDTRDEFALPSRYTRYMTAVLAYAGEVDRVLEIGFGGGRTAWYLHRTMPDLEGHLGGARPGGIQAGQTLLRDPARTEFQCLHRGWPPIYHEAENTVAGRS